MVCLKDYNWNYSDNTTNSLQAKTGQLKHLLCGTSRHLHASETSDKSLTDDQITDIENIFITCSYKVGIYSGFYMQWEHTL